MSTLMISLLVGAGVIAAMVAYRIISSRREEAKFKAQQKAMEDSFTGIGSMTGYSRNTQRTMHYPKAATPVARPRKVETTTDNTPDDLMLLSAAYASSPTPVQIASTDDDLRKTTLTGAGGTFDGGGSSGDWERTPTPTPSYEAPSRGSDSSYSSGSSDSSDSSSSYSSSDSSSSSSSSDSSSSSSSSD